MIDPQVSLAFALHSNPGAYAALIGSGVSVGAGIPTGWQVVLDLVSKLARVLGESPGDDLAGWYERRFGEEPDYSKLLDALARSPAERSALLRSYFEPTAEDRSRGVKLPGAAHMALVKLAGTGHVRLFVTTNFDRLIEQALEATGITPRVLSTPDSILGSPPLSHAGCTVVKLHGDYLDTRIKNTPAELDAYDESVDALLDQIIEEHGFIVCGWSGTWDTALRRAFERCKGRRYTTYWADVVPPGEHASRLIEQLEGDFIQVKGADDFFTDIVDKLKRLDGTGDAQTASRVAPARPKHNLLVQLTSFIGREEEIAEINGLLSNSRLVTLTGSGGSGKSRLAHEIGSSNLDRYPDGVWFVGLAPLSDPRLILGEVASVLDVGEDALYDFLRNKTILLILDNCEHLIVGVASLAQSLLSSPGVTVIATSREALNLAGERAFQVPPLPVPGDNADQVMVARCPSVELFLERAVAANPAFELTASNAASVKQIVRRIDGIPLAIELAASRVKLLQPAEIASRLEESFKLLKGGPIDALPHHQTLESCIDWSYDMLESEQQMLFRQLSVFRGGFTFPACGAVTGTDSEYEVLESLGQLVDKSLVGKAPASEETRYHLLEPLRQYAAARLTADEAAETNGRHARYFQDLAARASPELRGPDQLEWLARLEMEHDNLRVALAWGIESGNADLSQNTAASLTWFWVVRRHMAEAVDWFARVLAADGGSLSARASALVQSGFTSSVVRHDNLEACLPQIREGLAHFIELGDQQGVMTAQTYEAVLLWFQRDLEASTRKFAEIQAAHRTYGFEWGDAFCDFNLGSAAWLTGDLEQAYEHYARGLEMFQRLGDLTFIAWTLLPLANIALESDELDQATALYDQCLPMMGDLGDRHGVGAVLMGLGMAAHFRDEREDAQLLLTEAQTNLREGAEAKDYPGRFQTFWSTPAPTNC